LLSQLAKGLASELIARVSPQLSTQEGQYIRWITSVLRVTRQLDFARNTLTVDYFRFVRDPGVGTVTSSLTVASPGCIVWQASGTGLRVLILSA
jgi:hypothetical protein